MADGGHGGHGAHAGHGGGHAGHADVFQRRFWISLILTIPIILYSHMIQEWFGFSMPMFPGSNLIGPGLGTFIFLFGGAVFLAGGWSELRARKPGMMLLISLAIGVAFAASLATSLGWFNLDFWWELALLIDIMLLGHWQEMRAIGQARGALDALAALLPDEAERITATGTETVPIASLRPGDVVLVRPGGRVPADGEITEGEAELDESMITGESRPIEKGVGGRVVAGTVVAGAAIRVRVVATGADTALAGIQRLVEQAQTSRSRAQALADRFAALLFYVAVGAGLLTFIVWNLLGQPDDAVTRTVTVLVISCPHALGLAIPLVIALSTAIAARNGILIKDRLALERMRQVDTVLFDKTGTLTRGDHVVTAVIPAAGTEPELLTLAAAVEADSEHPLARAIVRLATERGLPIPKAAGFRAIAGRGVEATVDGEQIAIGGPTMLRERGLTPPPALASHTEQWADRGAAILHVVTGADRVLGAFALEDQIRPESRQAVELLHDLGIRVVMITGDARSVAAAVAADLGVDEVFAEVLPEEKDTAVATLQQRGERVAMVGDGVNDAPALARADVGIAIGAGTDVAIESAGVILATSDPRAVVGIITLSRASYRKMVENLVWAAGYNVVAIPLAAGVLAPIGFVLPPAMGAVLMSVSTIVVALNAQFLRRIDLTLDGAGG
ncbi:MAG: heavy metal translocating P-type ATPase [Chloroflexota bacterium]|nr:heavy metal translocating P-type ATPase [Chloroflexota bacterium]